MIQGLISKGYYRFEGDLKDLKFCISSFKIVRVINQAELDGIIFLNLQCRFKYRGKHHRVEIRGDMINKNILHIYYKGEMGV